MKIKFLTGRMVQNVW